jgi:hypothetical protein
MAGLTPTVAQLMKIHTALLQAQVELGTRGGELKRLSEIEMIPIGISVSPHAERSIGEAIAVVEELLKAVQA